VLGARQQHKVGGIEWIDGLGCWGSPAAPAFRLDLAC